MSGILTLDIGNTDIVTVLYTDDGLRLRDDRRMTIKEESYQRYQSFFQTIIKEFNVESPSAVILSCVVPQIRETVFAIMEETWPNTKLLSVVPGILPEMNVMLEEPRELGADIVATNTGAYYKYKDWTIVADLGSATKLSVIDGDFNFYGGIIVPGIAFQAKSLHQMIPHLPHIELKKPEHIVGQNTIASIQSGIINGSLAAIVELARQIEQEMGHPCRKIMTGGLAKLYTPEDLGDFEYDEFLLSDGLYQIAKARIQDEPSKKNNVQLD